MPTARRSAPAQNVPPSPCSTATAASGSASNARKASASAVGGDAVDGVAGVRARQPDRRHRPVPLHGDRTAPRLPGSSSGRYWSAVQPRAVLRAERGTGRRPRARRRRSAARAGSRGRSPCPTRASAHTDCTVRFTAPSSRAESGRRDGLVLRRPDRHPGRARSGVSSAAVEAGAAARCRWPAAGSRAGTGRARGRRRGRRATCRGAGTPASAPGGRRRRGRRRPTAARRSPRPSSRPGRRCPRRCAPGPRRPRAQGVRGETEVAGAVAGQPDDRRVAAGGGQHVGQRLHRSGPAAVAGHQQHGAGPVLRDRPGRRSRRRPRHEPRDEEPAATATSARSARTTRRRAGERPASTPLLSLLSAGAPLCCGIPGTEEALLSRDEYLAAWSRWHGGAGTASPLVRGWLSLAYALARPVAGLPPLAATALGLLVAAAAVCPQPPAGSGSSWRASWSGSPACWTPSTVHSPSPPAAHPGGGSSWTPSSTGSPRRPTPLRSGSRGARLARRHLRRALLAARLPAGAGGPGGRGETGALSVWERPTRVILTGMTLLGAGVLAGLDVTGPVVTTERPPEPRSERSRSSSWGSRSAGCWPTEPGRTSEARLGPRTVSLRLVRCVLSQQGTRHRAALPPIHSRGSVPCPLPSPAPSPPTT